MSRPQEFHGVSEFLTSRGAEVDGAALRKELSLDGLEELLKMLKENGAAAQAWSGVLGGYAIDSSKRLRVAALDVLGDLPLEVQLGVLDQPLMTVAPARARELLEHLVTTEKGRELLDRAIEAGAKVSKVAAEKRQRQDAVDLVKEPEAIELPPYEPIRRTVDETALRKELDKLVESRRSISGDDHWQRSIRTEAQKIKGGDIDQFIAILRGDEPRTALEKNALVKAIGIGPLLYQVRSIGMYGALQLTSADSYFHPWVLQKHVDPAADLRAIYDELRALGRNLHDAANLYRAGAVDVERAWPFFVEHPQVLEGWFAGDLNEQKNLNQLIQSFPALPQSVLEVLAKFALGDGVIARRQAQHLLTGHPVAATLALQGIDSGTSAVAASCAQWLATIKDPAVFPELTKRVEKEKRDLVRAGLLSAIDASGGDTSKYLSPERLAAEATKVLRAKLPKSLDWLPFDLVPTVHWRGGEVADRDLIKAWIVLADKTKNPDGSGLLARYLGLLEPHDAEELGRFIVQAWIAQDTAHPSEEDSHEYARAHAQQRYDWAQQSMERGRKRPEGPYEWELTYEGWTLEDFHKELFREHQSTYLGSAQADKGLLGFSVTIPGTELGQMVQSYIKEHRARRAQVEALTYALYGNGQQGALQVLMAIARQHPQRTVKEVANTLVARVAEDRGWSPAELADRTIPTAGFDEDGLLRLPFGSREFIGRMTGSGTIELTSPAGKVIKALPKPNAGDDEELAGESRKALTAARKELKAVLGIQRARLHEAMCAQRTWKAEDWTLYLRRHPILGQLISKLVWLAQDGETTQTFRPTEDGDLINLNDDSIELSDSALVSVAHRALMSDEDAAAWQEHLSDYEVAALFDQFGASVPQYNEDANSLEDLKGHMTDTFSFRGVATKRGYRRGQAEDAGWFSEYTKEYGELGITVRMEFTGSYLPEDNIPCATESVYFSTGRKDLKLKDVPRILIAEAYADYVALAALGPFDPKYRDKSGI
jgi:hypothetical protein